MCTTCTIRMLPRESAVGNSYFVKSGSIQFHVANGCPSVGYVDWSQPSSDLNVVRQRWVGHQFNIHLETSLKLNPTNSTSPQEQSTGQYH